MHTTLILLVAKIQPIWLISETISETIYKTPSKIYEKFSE